MFDEQSTTSEEHIQNDKTNRYHDNDDNNNNAGGEMTNEKQDDVIKTPWEGLFNLEQILLRLYRTSTPSVHMTRISGQEIITSGSETRTSGPETRTSAEGKTTFNEDEGTSDGQRRASVQEKVTSDQGRTRSTFLKEKNISGRQKVTSIQEGTEEETKAFEAPERMQQKWMYESIKGMEDITVEKGETTGNGNKSRVKMLTNLQRNVNKSKVM